LWDSQTHAQLQVISTHNHVPSVKFSPDGKTLAYGGTPNVIVLWDIKEKRSLRTLEGHHGHILSVDFSPDGETLASGAWDRTVRLWTIKADKRLAEIGKVGRPIPIPESTGRPPLLVAPFDEHQGKDYQLNWSKHLQGPVALTDSTGMKLVLVPAGEFLMGNRESPDELARAFAAYRPHAAHFRPGYPQHRVRITQPFYMGACEVTVGQFRQFVNDTGYKTDAETNARGGRGFDSSAKKFVWMPKYNWRDAGFPQTDSHPVCNVSWNDAVAFCHWLSQKEHEQYRLPTEAEWEYACRAGTTTNYWYCDNPDTLTEVANVLDASAKELEPEFVATSKRDGFVHAAPVGQFRPNAFGLYDIHGNVWEWCTDWFDENYYAGSPQDDPVGPDIGSSRVLRGGSWGAKLEYARSADRGGLEPIFRSHLSGFRVVRVPQRDGHLD